MCIIKKVCGAKWSRNTDKYGKSPNKDQVLCFKKAEPTIAKITFPVMLEKEKQMWCHHMGLKTLSGLFFESLNNHCEPMPELNWPIPTQFHGYLALIKSSDVRLCSSWLSISRTAGLVSALYPRLLNLNLMQAVKLSINLEMFLSGLFLKCKPMILINKVII